MDFISHGCLSIISLVTNMSSSCSSVFYSYLMFTFIFTSLPWFRISNYNLIVSAELYSESRPKCEEINVPMCRGIGYNMTSMPNQFHHEKQDEAGLEAHQFWPLVEINCSDDLRFFLCSMYTPICMEDYHERLPACRSVCERAQSGCASIMSQYGFPWPESMDCNNFPPYGSPNHLCMDQKEGASPPSPPPPPPPPPQLVSSSSSPPQTFFSSSPSPPPSSSIYSTTSTSSPKPPSIITSGSNVSHISTTKYPDLIHGKTHGHPRAGCHCHCRPPLVTIHEPSDHYSRIITGGITNCAQACHLNPFYTKQEQSKSLLLVTITAFACLICSLLVVCTYLTDRSRFCYPERAIIFLSGCYVMVSIGFLLRYQLGHSSIACEGSRLRYSGIGIQSFNCTTVFIFIYFFGMAASLWWVNLTLAWFLSASLKWSTEAIDNHSWYFHALAWGVPAIKSYLAVSTWAVDAEPLAGICLVGNLNPHHLMHFIIAPLCAYLIVGIFLLLSGLISLMRIRRAIRKHARQVTDKIGLVKLMIRIIIFSVLYIVPTLVVIICNLYQYSYGPIWEVNHNCHCSTNRLETPYVTIHLFKYVMTLVVGITTCFWIISGKTLESWWHCTAERLCCCWGIKAPNPRGQLIGSTGGGSSQYIVNSQRSYKQINHIAHLSGGGGGQPHRKISLSHV
ncbi:frizzled-8-like [Panonychus citri]|uniref:frizzled-8-like n=1 Tax=Panonychus citri TaxID=50023 RepID=UPI0023078D6F|nr:frizzled-8-like [Panonychus citri]